MWLSRRRRAQTGGGAAVGRTTLEGENTAVYLDGERRGVAVYAPGGYRWRPKLGQELLVLKGPEGFCVAGAESIGGDVEPGEVAITALAGGAEVRLRNDGIIELRGDVRINGRRPLLEG